jgi:recombination protein RecA
MDYIDAAKKKHGAENIHRGVQSLKGIKGVSTGSIRLNKATGIGGYPEGRIVEIFGPEHSGKTTMAIHAMAEAQKKGTVAFIDVEYALDLGYAESLGVDLEKLVLVYPENAEQAFDIATDLVNSGDFALIALDSVAALVPKAEIEGEMTDMQVGLQARVIGKGVRRICQALHKHNTTFIFINQLRMKVGIAYGNPETRPGGKSLDYFASMMIQIRRGTLIKKGETVIGHTANITITKNKVGGMPQAKTEFDIMWGYGINACGEILDEAEELGIVEKSGAWYSFDGERIGQGRDNAIEFVRNHKELQDKMADLVRAAVPGTKKKAAE